MAGRSGPNERAAFLGHKMYFLGMAFYIDTDWVHFFGEVRSMMPCMWILYYRNLYKRLGSLRN